MNFIGTGRLITPDDIRAEAAGLGIEAATLRSVVLTEAAGKGFDAKNRPKALFEFHWFHKLLSTTPGVNPKRLAMAKEQGLAFAVWDKSRYPKTSDGVYDLIQRACMIHEELALRSTSWGLGQVLGANLSVSKDPTYKSAVELVEAMKTGERAQLDLMLDYIRSRKGLVQALRELDFATFADGYNGHGYKANAYDVKLRDNRLRAIKEGY